MHVRKKTLLHIANGASRHIFSFKLVFDFFLGKTHFLSQLLRGIRPGRIFFFEFHRRHTKLSAPPFDENMRNESTSFGSTRSVGAASRWSWWWGRRWPGPELGDEADEAAVARWIFLTAARAATRTPSEPGRGKHRRIACVTATPGKIEKYSANVFLN